MLSAVIASAAVPGMVAGCAPTGPSSQELREQLVVAVEAVPNVSGALVNISNVGLESVGIRLKLYVDDAAQEVLAVTIDSALTSVWRTTVIEPANVSLSAVAGPMPADPRMSTPDGVELAPIAAALGLGPVRTSLDVLIVPVGALTQRYGPWVAPSHD